MPVSEEIIIYILFIFIFLLGLTFGSFLNVVALRTLEGKSIVYPSSHCPVCGTRLKPAELIPIASYILQKGRCRTCGAPISLLYPFGELLTGFYFVVWFYPLFKMWRGENELQLFGRSLFGSVGTTQYLLSGLFLIALVVVITIADIRAMIIPDRILWLAVPFMLALVIWIDGYTLLMHFLGSLLYGGVFLLTYWVSRDKMGLGDVKYAFILGFWLGPRLFLFFLLIASFSALVFALGRSLIDRHALREPLPFGPFMGATAVLLTLFGEALWQWYLQLFIGNWG